MNQDKFPPGWNDKKVRKVLAHYEEQTEAEALVEDEAAMEPAETVMSVPHDLVPKVRELIAKRHG
jgi:hypothetical protein